MPLYVPQGKKRTALLRKLKAIFRSFRSQPVGELIATINPILRGWVKYFAVGHASRCFSYIQDWVEKKIRRHLDRARQRRGFWMATMEPSLAVPDAGTLQGVPREQLAAKDGSRAMRIGPISLEAKCAGAPSAGNPHAGCEVAGAGNGATDTATRARRGKPPIQPSQVLTGHRASSRPYRLAASERGPAEGCRRDPAEGNFF